MFILGSDEFRLFSNWNLIFDFPTFFYAKMFLIKWTFLWAFNSSIVDINNFTLSLMMNKKLTFVLPRYSMRKNLETWTEEALYIFISFGQKLLTMSRKWINDSYLCTLGLLFNLVFKSMVEFGSDELRFSSIWNWKSEFPIFFLWKKFLMK